MAYLGTNESFALLMLALVLVVSAIPEYTYRG
jgi:hypothetical protein